MRRVTLDKIASVTWRLALDPNAVLGEEIPAVAGTVVAARVLNAKASYNTLEDVHGRMVALHPGDVVAGALGHRDALYGFAGRVPETVVVGDELSLLNIGGVIGQLDGPSPAMEAPFRLEILGSVQEFPYFGRRVGLPAQVARAALPVRVPDPDELPPLVAFVGTSMDAGKTTAAAALVRALVRRGLSVAAGKMTGVSLRRDVLMMQDCGAAPVAIFTDFGVVTTNRENVVPAAHGLVAHLSEARPDLIVLEMGDGLLGTYGVDALLCDARLAGAFRAVVLCAQDPVGAWGAQELLRERYGLAADVVSGRVTDGASGVRFCREQLGLPGHNALRDGEELAKSVLAAIARRQGVGSSWLGRGLAAVS
jgi:hypothetical protein